MDRLVHQMASVLAVQLALFLLIPIQIGTGCRVDVLNGRPHPKVLTGNGSLLIYAALSLIASQRR